MEHIACPTHLSLGSFLAEHLLDQHAESLPDLTRIALLVPNNVACRTLRPELASQASARGFPALLLPDISTLKNWVRQHNTFDGSENELSNLLDLATTLRRREVSDNLGIGDSWSVANDLASLFRDLWLNEITLPEDPDALKKRLQEAYGIKDAPPPQLSREADIINLLWKAWDDRNRQKSQPGKILPRNLAASRTTARSRSHPCLRIRPFVCRGERGLAEIG